MGEARRLGLFPTSKIFSHEQTFKFNQQQLITIQQIEHDDRFAMSGANTNSNAARTSSTMASSDPGTQSGTNKTEEDTSTRTLLEAPLAERTQPALVSFQNVQSLRWTLKRKPVTREEFRSLIPVAAIDESWSDQDEADLKQEWANHPYKAVLDTRRQTRNYCTPENALWRNVAWIFRCLPTDIIPLSTMELVKREGGAITTDDADDPRWSSRFCKHLNDYLLVHRQWFSGRRGYVLITVALQIAVICRTDDRRPWRGESFATTDVFLNTLISEWRQIITPKPMEDIVETCLQRLNGVGDSWWARYCHSITKLTKKLRSKVRIECLSIQPIKEDGSPNLDRYQLITGDLQRVARAIAFADGRMGVKSRRDIQSWYTLLEVTGDLPYRNSFPMFEDICDALEAVYIEELRRQKKEVRSPIAAAAYPRCRPRQPSRG